MTLAFLWLVGAVAEKYEWRLAPVVSDFTMHVTGEEAEFVLVDGAMRKRRHCEFLHLIGYVGDLHDPETERERLAIRFLNGPSRSSGDGTRDPGLQRWGPWRIARPQNVDGPHLWLRVTHRCNPFYETSGVYFLTEAERVFASER